MKALGVAFSQTANIAQSFGSGPLANLLLSFHESVVVTRELNKELGRLPCRLSPDSPSPVSPVSRSIDPCEHVEASPEDDLRSWDAILLRLSDFRSLLCDFQ